MIQPLAPQSLWINALIERKTFLDVRAPIEFSEGHLPGAVNLPLLDDSERELVGTCYKQKGPDEAVLLGHQLVGGAVKERRLEQWIRLLRANPDSLLYCFRGGQRSALTQDWLKERGVTVARIEGGYKRVRQFLLEQLDIQPHRLNIFCLSGQTGAGKTTLLRLLAKESVSAIDLEGLAHHRGSAFGNELEPQPSQADFENQLALEFMRMAGLSPSTPLWIEDEARTIGRIVLGEKLFHELRTGPLVVIDEDRPSRAKTLLQEYVIDTFNQIRARGHPEPYLLLSERLTGAAGKISRKLGGFRTKEVLALVQKGIASRDAWDEHLDWIHYLLEHYYDPYYTRHLEKHKARVVFKGRRDEVRQFALSHPPSGWF